MIEIPYGTRVHVRRQDILNGDPLSCDTCPVALALKRKFPEAGRIMVRGYARDFKDNQIPSVEVDGIHYRVSRIVREFVLDFDESHNGYLMRPFGFRILERLN